MDAATVAIDKRMFRLGKQGLQRLTWSSVVDLRALAKTAHNAAMIRLERELDVLATHVERYMNRDPLFTLHGSGHNPRGTQLHRVRQRFMHKLKYYVDKYDAGIQCVGCGRCIRLCPVNIDIRRVCGYMNSHVASADACEV